MKIRVVFLDYDQTYLNRLSSALSEREDCSAEIYSFSNPERAFETLREIGNCIFVVSDRFEVDADAVPKGVCLALITEKRAIREIGDLPAIYRYQKADAIFQEILAVYSGTFSSDVVEMEAHTGKVANAGVYTFLPCGGGSGASTAAAAFALRMASIGMVPLYLNLERFGTSEMYFSSESKTHIGDLLYAIRSKRGNLPLRLKSALSRSEEGVYFIESCRAATEAMEITAEDVNTLLEKLRDMGKFDCIVIDTDFLLEGPSLEIMRQATSIVLVTNGEPSSHMKLERIYGAMEIISTRDEVEFPSTLLLYNGFSSKTGSTEANVDIAVLGGIPRYEGASPKRIARRISQMTFFDTLI